MHKTETLEIRHQISTDGAGFIVREMFGGQPAIEWRVPTLELAKRLADERRETAGAGHTRVAPRSGEEAGSRINGAMAVAKEKTEPALLSACDAYAGEVKTLARRIAELEAELAAIHATSRRVTHHYEWYLDGVRQSPGVYVVMRVGDAPDAPVTPF